LEIGCLPYFHTWCDLTANLECRSEMCCTRLAGNAGPKIANNSPSGHHRTTLSGCIFATKARIDSRKKLSNVSPRSPHNTVNFGPLTAEIVSLVCCLTSFKQVFPIVVDTCLSCEDTDRQSLRWCPDDEFLAILGAQLISTGFASWQRYCMTL